MVGVDFCVNVTLDREMRLTGVFAGDLEVAFDRAVQDIREFVDIRLDETFDIVLTHGGYVGRNHYQTAKAAVGALPAVKKNGVLIIAGNHRDPDPVGGEEYRTLIHLLKLQGPEGYVEMLKTPHWKFTKDQWEPEVWARVLRKVGENGLIYCSPEISKEDYMKLPGISGWDFAGDVEGSNAKIAQTMVQNALVSTYDRFRTSGMEPQMALIREGPYAVPSFSGSQSRQA
jgi:hypothetical protein